MRLLYPEKPFLLNRPKILSSRNNIITSGCEIQKLATSLFWGREQSGHLSHLGSLSDDRIHFILPAREVSHKTFFNNTLKDKRCRIAEYHCHSDLPSFLPSTTNQKCYKREKNIAITIESWNFVKPRSMGTSEVTWRLIISGASKTSEYIVCKVDSFKLCSSQDKDWTNSGINCSEQKKRKSNVNHSNSQVQHHRKATFLKCFSVECLKTKTKVITTANQNKGKYQTEPIRNQSKNTEIP